MPNIIQLDRHVADLIAAGEVVERPASAVKELVENAVDAGAKSVTVEIQNGGMTLMRVTDDGCGMLPEDARTAFLRHATSKIRTKEDLAAIHTLGFRGEALAAIASVSKIDLLTRPSDQPEGVSLHLENGRILSEQPAGCPAGTTILVRNLFYNTPARMKFMKSDAAESSAVFSVVQQQALAHPEISFRLLKDGEQLLRTDGQDDLLSAIYAVFGRELASNLLPVDGSWEKLRVRGYVTKPTATRGNRTWQTFFVNGRFIKSRLLCAAVEEAYKNQMMAGRFPACVLKISMPVQAVDVNVHPAKTEVKFLSEREVFDAVHYAVLSTLSKASGRPEMKLPPLHAAPAQPAAAARPREDYFKTMQAGEYRRQLSNDAPKASAPVLSDSAPRLFASGAVTPPKGAAQSETFFTAVPETLPVGSSAPAAAPPAEAKKPAAKPEAEIPAQQALPIKEKPWTIIGETLNTYIIVEQGDAVLFIDKHAAHERIRFEALKAQKTPIMAQLLLSPVSAELGKEEAAAVLEQQALLSSCGFGVEDFGAGGVLLRQIPADLDPEGAVAALQELAAMLVSGRRPDPNGLRDELLHSMACKSAIKGGWHTDPAEREALVREVLTRDDIKYCPHGRPVCIVLTRHQLEKQFKRT